MTRKKANTPEQIRKFVATELTKLQIFQGTIFERHNDHLHIGLIEDHGKLLAELATATERITTLENERAEALNLAKEWKGLKTDFAAYWFCAEALEKVYKVKSS